MKKKFRFEKVLTLRRNGKQKDGEIIVTCWYFVYWQIIVTVSQLSFNYSSSLVREQLKSCRDGYKQVFYGTSIDSNDFKISFAKALWKRLKRF